jgi:hypothetical protein
MPHPNFILFCLGFGVGVGSLVAWLLGYGWAQGAFYGAGGGVLLIILSAVFDAFSSVRERPDCRCRRSRGSDLVFTPLVAPVAENNGITAYEFSSFDFDPKNPDACEYCYVCPRCKARWNVSNSICYEILPGNRARPYKRQKWSGTWVDL